MMTIINPNPAKNNLPLHLLHPHLLPPLHLNNLPENPP